MASKIEKRRREIINLIEMDGVLYGDELSKLLNVTKETIRTDLDFLVANYGYTRIHGGIKKEKQESYNQHYIFHEKKQINVDAKKRMCYKAMDIIEDDSCIFVDSGSTVSYLLNYFNKKNRVTVVTASIAFLMKFTLEGYDQIFEEHQHKLIFVGGSVNQNLLSTYGVFFDQMVQNFYFDQVICSVDAVDINRGLMDVDEVAFSVMQKINERSFKKIVLADESKFGFSAHYQVYSWHQIDYLISDKVFDNPWLQVFKEKGVISLSV